MRQIFVRESNRSEGIGSSLYKRRLQFARDLNLLTARANVREETKQFYTRYNPQMFEEDTEYYIIREV